MNFFFFKYQNSFTNSSLISILFATSLSSNLGFMFMTIAILYDLSILPIYQEKRKKEIKSL